ncbi:MAG: MaoC family dehydratase [Candidatus Helarchaeota archaeon]
MPRDEHFDYTLPPLLENLDEAEILNQIPKITLQPCYWDELVVGDKASLHIKVSRKIILLYAMLSNDYNPIHVDLEYGQSTFFKNNIAHGILVLSFCSGVVGSHLVGEGVALIGFKNAQFKDAVKIDDEVIATAEISKKYSLDLKGKTRYFVEVTIKVIHKTTHSVAAEGTATILVFHKSRP